MIFTFFWIKKKQSGANYQHQKMNFCKMIKMQKFTKILTSHQIWSDFSVVLFNFSIFENVVVYVVLRRHLAVALPAVIFHSFHFAPLLFDWFYQTNYPSDVFFPPTHTTKHEKKNIFSEYWNHSFQKNIFWCTKTFHDKKHFLNILFFY